jgi:hypothetical protein
VLGIPTAFKRAELVTRVVVESPGGEGEESPQLTAISTVWKFQAGRFVEQHDPTISAQVVAQILTPDFVGPGPAASPIHVCDSVMIKLPDAVRGPTTAAYRIQAISAGSRKLANVIDRLDDSPGELGRAVDWSPHSRSYARLHQPSYRRVASAALHVSGFVTKFDRDILKKTGGVMNVFFDDQIIATRQPHGSPKVSCVQRHGCRHPRLYRRRCRSRSRRRCRSNVGGLRGREH